MARIHAGGRSREYEEIIGYHLERAFELQSELGRAADALSVGRKASLHLAKAGTRALARGDMAAATNLLHRSVALLPPNDPDRLGLLPELADALIYSGKFDRAEALLDEAIDEAGAQGNERLQWHARVERTLLHRQTDPSSGGAALDEAFAAIDFFRSAQDDLGLSRAYFLVQEVHLDELLYAKAETFLHKGLAHARKAGDERGITDILAALAFAGLWGPAPVEKAIARCERILAESGDNRRVASAALRSLGGLEAMRGDFATAEELLRRGFLILDELGLTFSAAASCQVWAVLETLRGNPEAAESHLRRGFEVLSEMGEMYVRATVAGALGEALWAQGRYEEASAFVTIGEETAAADDLVSRAKWRAVRAKLLTLEGKTDHGTALAHEAVELLSNSDFLDLRGDCFADLSEVLRRAGREQESMQALEEAASFYEQKGNTVSAGRVRRLAGVGASDAPS